MMVAGSLVDVEFYWQAHSHDLQSLIKHVCLLTKAFRGCLAQKCLHAYAQ